MNSANDDDRTRDHRLGFVRFAADHRLQRQHVAITQLNTPSRADLDVGDDGPDAHGVIAATSVKLLRLDKDTHWQFDAV